ncbi:MAG: methionine--tRNA ligase [Gammaproteobacteria bacterium]|nr:methionine--tRNA ligase [Gammaproteobacteria bacterium]
MNDQTLYISTSIPYVNAAPHLGFAQELVIADAMARHYQRRGFDVRFQTGSDENSLKNVRAAQDAGMPVEDWVASHAEQFRSLKETLDLSFDDFIRTSSEQRHALGVEALWQHCMAGGDLYRRHYRGLYCVGCEQFYEPGELVDGACPEHLAPLEMVEEENWFFRLSRYAEPLRKLIETDVLHVQPAKRKREVLDFIDRGLHDFSVSRSRERAHGWGIPVPGDPDQVLYVWFDALGNYVSALGYGSDDDRLFSRYWTHAARRIHVIGKGVVRFHAIYWPAMLLSAGVPLPTEARIHDYLTVDGIKITKSRGNAIGPGEAVARHGVDAVRYYLLRHVRTTEDGDFSYARLADVYRTELADGLGNLLSRTLGLIQPGMELPGCVCDSELSELVDRLPRVIDTAVESFQLHQGLRMIWRLVDAANAYVSRREPWKLAREGDETGLREVLDDLLTVLERLAEALAPFLPTTARRIQDATSRARRGERSVAVLFPKH